MAPQVHNIGGGADKRAPGDARTPLPVSKGATKSYGSCENTSSGYSSGGGGGGGDNKKQQIVGQNGNKRAQKRPPPAQTLSAAAKAHEAAAAAAAADDAAEQRSWLHKLAKRVPCLGILFALLASLFLGSAGMLVKMVSSVNGIQVAVLRAVIQLIVYGIILCVRRLNWLPKRGELWPVAGRAVLGGASITFSYYALKLIPLGDATTIRFSLPIWTLIVSYFILNESCSTSKILAVIVCISGVVMIAKPDTCIYLFHMLAYSLQLESESDLAEHLIEFESARHKLLPHNISPQTNLPYRQLEGSLLALASSICLSMSMIALRMCKRTPAEVIIMWLSIVSIVIGTITLLAIDDWSLPNNWPDILYILLNGACGTIGQWFVTCALKIEQSGVIALARTFDIEVAFLYSAFLLHEHIRVTSIVGSVLVSLGVVAVVLPKWSESREARRNERHNNTAQQQQQQQQQQRPGGSGNARHAGLANNHDLESARHSASGANNTQAPSSPARPGR